MINLKNGCLAGFIGTVVLSAMTVAKRMMGVMPELDVVVMLSIMIMVIPMAGADLFGMTFGIMAPMMTLVLHMVFGRVYGARVPTAIAH